MTPGYTARIMPKNNGLIHVSDDDFGLRSPVAKSRNPFRIRKRRHLYRSTRQTLPRLQWNWGVTRASDPFATAKGLPKSNPVTLYGLLSLPNGHTRLAHLKYTSKMYWSPKCSLFCVRPTDSLWFLWGGFCRCWFLATAVQTFASTPACAYTVDARQCACTTDMGRK